MSLPAGELVAEKARERGNRERDELRNRLLREGAFDLAKKLDGCGAPMPLVCCNCGEKKVVEVRCKRRWCPACAWSVQRERMQKFDLACCRMMWPMMITLTVPNSADPECIREIRKNWSKMRRRKLIVDRVLGGVSTIEVSNNGNEWHPHLHIIADCRWLALHTPEPTRRDTEGVYKQKCEHAQMELSAVWGSIIGIPSAVVWVQRKKPGEALAYALKYAVKGSELIAAKNDIAPLIRVLSKSRMVSAFGNLHGQTPVDDEEEKWVCECTECGETKSFIPQEMETRARIQAFDKWNCR